jgi:hypothetical protein
MAGAKLFFKDYPDDDFIPPHLLIISDDATPFPPRIAEKDLHDFWMRQIPGVSQFQSTSDETVEVVHIGAYNRDAGPDFCRATIKLDGKIVQGDIEFHLDGRDWFQHGHDADPAYNSVVLHLSLRGQNQPPEIRRENGLPITQILLTAHDLPPSEPEPRLVVECPLSRTTPEKIVATVRRAGQFRLEQKAAAFAEQLVQYSWDQTVYQGIAEALGYDKNQEAFRALAKMLPVDLLFAEMRAHDEDNEIVLPEALLFGGAGFLDGDDHGLDEDTRLYLASRRRIWQRISHPLRLRSLPQNAWRFFRLRPANFPTRRIAGLAVLLRRLSRHGVLEHLLRLVGNGDAKPKTLAQELLNFFIVSAEGFWERRCDFQSRPAGLPAPSHGDLIGSARALDIVVNVILPALLQYAGQAGEARLMTALSELYACLPSLQSNLITRRMTEQLSQHHMLPKQFDRGALAQQGLIYLQKLLCRPLQCETCMKFAKETAA